MNPTVNNQTAVHLCKHSAQRVMSLKGNVEDDSNIMQHSSREITHLAFVKSCGSCEVNENYLRQAC